MIRLLTFFLLLLWFPLQAQTTTPQLRIFIDSIGVTTRTTTYQPELGWVDESLPLSIPRRAALLPLKIFNRSTNDWIGPTVENSPGSFTNGFAGPIVRDLWSIEIVADDGRTIRYDEFGAWMFWDVPALDFNEYKVGLKPGAFGMTVARNAMFDLSGVPNGEYFFFVQFDPSNLYGGYCNLFLRVVIDQYKVIIIKERNERLKRLEVEFKQLLNSQPHKFEWKETHKIGTNQTIKGVYVCKYCGDWTSNVPAYKNEICYKTLKK